MVGHQEPITFITHTSGVLLRANTAPPCPLKAELANPVSLRFSKSLDFSVKGVLFDWSAVLIIYEQSKVGNMHTCMCTLCATLYSDRNVCIHCDWWISCDILFLWWLPSIIFGYKREINVPGWSWQTVDVDSSAVKLTDRSHTPLLATGMIHFRFGRDSKWVNREPVREPDLAWSVPKKDSQAEFEKMFPAFNLEQEACMQGCFKNLVCCTQLLCLAAKEAHLGRHSTRHAA